MVDVEGNTWEDVWACMCELKLAVAMLSIIHDETPASLDTAREWRRMRAISTPPEVWTRTEPSDHPEAT